MVSTVAMVLVVPLPKSQNRLVSVPAELSVNTTWNGATPLVPSALNCASGVIAPCPTTKLVAIPPSLVTIRLLVNPPVARGVKLTTKLVALYPGTVNAPPVTTANGAALVAVPLN